MDKKRYDAFLHFTLVFRTRTILNAESKKNNIECTCTVLKVYNIDDSEVNRQELH